MWDPYADFQTQILANGLTVYAAYWPGRPWEVLGFLVHSGAEQDPAGLEGLAHFVEHAVSENANRSKKDIFTFFKNCGGIVDFGSTSYFDTQYRCFVPADKAIIAKVLSIFGDMLLLAELKNCIERERQVIISEFHQYYPFEFEYDLVLQEHQILYPGYWLERFARPLGNPESVSQITQNDLQDYYDRHYIPANISIVGVGGLTLSELVEVLSESPFMANKKGIRTPLPTPTTDAIPPAKQYSLFELSKYTTTSVAVGGYRSVARIPGNVSLQSIRLASAMFNEALNEEVRERSGWSYSAGSSYQKYRYFSQFTIFCEALPLNSLGKIEDVVNHCIASLRDEKGLFEQVKQWVLASIPMIDPNGNNVCSCAFDDLVFNQRITSLVEEKNDVEKVTINDICNLLQWLAPERRWTVISRP